MIDRYDFLEKYGVRPTVIYKLDIGQTYVNEKKNLHFTVVDHIRNPESGFYDSITFDDGSGLVIVDLMPHWERCPDTGIRFSRDGVMNLIRAVYAKAEEDYEALYLNGDEEIEISRIPGENDREFGKRRMGLYKEAVKECELLLGDLYIKYAKVKALWKESHDPFFMAQKLNDTPEHIVCIIDRLGLNRSYPPVEADYDDRTVKLSSDLEIPFMR